MSPLTLTILEWASVVLNVAFTLCIAWEKRMGWALGFVASAIGAGLYALAHTWAMSALNVYYVLMAVYGWWSWGRTKEERITSQRWVLHAVVVPAALVLAYGVAALLGQFLNGSYPQLDAFVTVFSFIATWMMARKYISTWYYFIVADAMSIWLNWRIGYVGFAALNAVYLVLSVIGLVKWGRLLAQQRRQSITA